MITHITTDNHTEFMLMQSDNILPAPILLLLSHDGVSALKKEPFCLTGRILHAQGWNVVSLDIPCHGSQCRDGEAPELAGWAERTAAQKNFIPEFQTRAAAVLSHLITAGIADPDRIAAAGTSRAGFLAFQTAAADERIKAIAAFAPVTDLLALREFAGQEDNKLARGLALRNTVSALTDRDAWIVIGNADERVGTGNAVEFAELLRASSSKEVICNVVDIPGHTSVAAWHDDAAAWLEKKI